MASFSTTFRITGIEGLPAAASWLLGFLGNRRIVAVNGEMGAGKTSFIRSLCLQLGVTQEVTSPTFALVNEYLDRADEAIYHFDFYRIENPVEALDFGLEEYLASGCWCLMEWPDRISAFLPEETVWLQISELADQSREFLLQIPA